MERQGFTLYVPVAGSPLRESIDPGSGIVGTPIDDRILIDYEGNRHDSVNLRTYAERCWNAHDRHVNDYPTVARAWVQPEQLLEVGFLDPAFHAIHVDRHDIVDEWCALAVALDNERQRAEAQSRS